LQVRPFVEVDLPAREGVDASPTPGDLQQGERADAARECRVDDAVIPDGLESEDRSQEQQRRARRLRCFLLEAVAAQAQAMNDCRTAKRCRPGSRSD